jgi:hypothetical protein
MVPVSNSRYQTDDLMIAYDYLGSILYYLLSKRE